MTFRIKTEDEQRLDHIRDLVDSCEKSLTAIEGPRGVGILKEDKLAEARHNLRRT